MMFKANFKALFYLLTVYFVANCQPIFATTPSKCAKLLEAASIKVAPLSLWDLLNKETHNGAEIIDLLSQNPTLKELYSASAGVSEGYSIKEHTLMVFDIFAKQYSTYQRYYKFEVPADVRLFQTLKFAIALHDIGKPNAIEAGNKNLQHEFTVPILNEALTHFGFSTNEVKLAKALVGNDVMGDLVKGIIDPKQAKNRLEKVANEAGMPLSKYVPLQFLFYTIDAASYPMLRQRIFTTTSDGLLIPNRSQFQNLWTEIDRHI